MKDFVLIVSALASLSACSKSNNEPTESTSTGVLAGTLAAGVSRPAPVVTHAAAPAHAPAPTAVPMAAPPPTSDTVVDVSKRTMSVDKYERLVLNLEGCKLERYQIDTNCAGMQALTEAINASSTWSDRAAVNAQIDGEEIVYHDYVDISVAVSAPNGLVVPVVRDCDKLSFAGIEKAIADYGKKAKEGALTMEDMAGGTFTISNGGVFGSLMSTPIINPPQSAVLGLHRIEDRAVVVDGQIVIRPMMYIALSYDHRLIDGREAVTALKIIKEAIEDPTRLLIDL